MCVYKQIIDVSILDPRWEYMSLTKVPMQQKKSTRISLAGVVTPVPQCYLPDIHTVKLFPLKAFHPPKSASTVSYLLHILKISHEALYGQKGHMKFTIRT